MVRLATAIVPVLLAASSLAHAADPIVTNGDKYRVILENERVLIAEVEEPPAATADPSESSFR